MDNAGIKENIIRRRMEKGLSQDDMAQRLGMSRNSYRNLEKGQTAILNKHIIEIAMVLGTTVEEILLGFKPTDCSESLEDVRMTYSRTAESMKSTYETEIANMEKEVTAQKMTISDLREIIDSKNEIIQLLKRENATLRELNGKHQQ